ncbi:OLC1v1035608C1 [Oldenlandia corymbosa var. corymbosa]|uniref:OLC1v1035608C1 n=1 Tax=Oldenlandia corymbosa var. corymbosa TaxID=529605 RepID=A0AAV1CV92_OLDCO|nr:OLC1v1035608C1 [Oldenlandia corymbosa var. corymbosa]
MSGAKRKRTPPWLQNPMEMQVRKTPVLGVFLTGVHSGLPYQNVGPFSNPPDSTTQERKGIEFCGKNRDTADEWVVCRVFHKNTGINNRRSPLRDLARADSFLDHFLNDDDPSLPPLMDNEIPCCSTDKACSIFPRDDEEELKVAGLESSSGKLFMPAYYNYANKNSMEASSSSTTCQNSNLYYCHPPSLNPISTTNIRDDNYCSEKRHQNSCFKVTSPPPGYNYQQANSSNVSAAIQGVLQSNRKYCKMEPFYSSNINNNNSMLSPSQDTGISYDLAPEISSIHQNNKSYREDLPGVSVDPSMSDLDSLWEYY